jgi:hypothetical protein
MEKEKLVQDVKEWININKEITNLKLRKKEITQNLLQTMKNNSIDCFDTSNGSLCYKKNKVKKPFNTKTILYSLQEYFKTTNSKTDLSEDIIQFLLENREEQIKETIICKK